MIRQCEPFVVNKRLIGFLPLMMIAAGFRGGYPEFVGLET